MTELLIEKDVALAPFTTFRIGGKARFFTRVGNLEELKEALDFAAQNPGLPVFILGGGSNILVSDNGFPGLVIKIEMRGVLWEEEDLPAQTGGRSVLVRAAAGENWDELVKGAVKRELYGMENLSGIPGTTGASVIQNIGAYGAEIKNIVESVQVFNPQTREIKNLNKEDCQFGYRESLFKRPEGKHFIVIEVIYRLAKAGELNLSYKDLKTHFKNERQPSLQKVREAVIVIRQAKFPNLSEVGTAGSFFKNPFISKEKFQELQKTYPTIPNWRAEKDKTKISAAWLLDKVGNFRGVKKGDVGSYQNQSLVLVNFGTASVAEVNALADEMQQVIKKKVGIELEREVQFIF